MENNPTIEITTRDGRSREYAEDGVTLLKIDGVPVATAVQSSEFGVQQEGAEPQSEIKKSKGGK